MRTLHHPALSFHFIITACPSKATEGSNKAERLFTSKTAKSQIGPCLRDMKGSTKYRRETGISQCHRRAVLPELTVMPWDLVGVKCSARWFILGGLWPTSCQRSGSDSDPFVNVSGYLGYLSLAEIYASEE